MGAKKKWNRSMEEMRWETWSGIEGLKSLHVSVPCLSKRDEHLELPFPLPFLHWITDS
jgi:hypothetical protein